MESAQTLDLARNTMKSDAIEVVPAPRLELGTPWCLLRRLFPTTARCSTN